MDAKKRLSLLSFLSHELTRSYWPENDRAKFTERRKRVYSFFNIPRELEKFMLYGFLQCLDAFLYIFTILPLRFIKTILKVLLNVFYRTSHQQGDQLLDPAEICDLLKVVVLVTTCFLTDYVDVSMMYHVIRGQTVIKLYIFFNMLDVADKLCSSFGQDILDSLFWTATEKRGRRRDHMGLIPHLVFGIVYVFIHTILVLLQANTLNVAFNSHNKALLTIMMSNNFVELKASVFKKFEKSNLFQMSCSDVRERFHLTILLLVVAVRNLAQFNWTLEHFWVLLPDMFLVLGCEFLVDWVKHAFITKFNDIPFDVYREYSVSLAYDMVGSRHRDAFSDHVDVVSRRMGFIPLPLAVLMVRVTMHLIRIMSWLDVFLLAIFFLCLLTLKILNCIILLGVARDLIQQNKDQLKQQQQQQQSNELFGVFKTASKDDLDLPFTMASTEEQELVLDLASLPKRSQSLIEFPGENKTKDDPSLADYSSNDTEMDISALLRKYSLNSPESLLFNSTVSLNSVIENEIMEQDLEKFGNQKVSSDPAAASSSVGSADAASGGGNVNSNNASDSNCCRDDDGGCSGDMLVAEVDDSLVSPRKRRNTANRKSESSDQPKLSEVDRYTMCSNRII